jgi:cell division protein YceG involved in septum cleavage
MTKTLTNFYRDYRTKNKDTHFDLVQGEYKFLVKVLIKEILNDIQSGKTFKFPFNLGDFYIYKKRQKRKPIDWKNTKKFGKYIYHLNLHSDGLIFKYKWNKNKARFINKSIYEFKPSRANARALAKLAKADNLEIVKIK